MLSANGYSSIQKFYDEKSVSGKHMGSVELFRTLFLILNAGAVVAFPIEACPESNLIQCGVKDAGTVYLIQLSRKGVNIVLIHLNTMDTTTGVSWQNKEIQKRSSVEGSTLFPVEEAQLVFRFNSLECNDGGEYTCNIIYTNASGQFSQDIFIEKNFTGCPCEDEAGISPTDGNTQSTESSLTKENDTFTDPSPGRQFSDSNNTLTHSKVRLSGYFVLFVFVVVAICVFR